MPTAHSTESFILDKNLGSKKNFVEIELCVSPKTDHKFNTVKVSKSIKEDIPYDALRAIDHGIKSALNKG